MGTYASAPASAPDPNAGPAPMLNYNGQGGAGGNQRVFRRAQNQRAPAATPAAAPAPGAPPAAPPNGGQSARPQVPAGGFQPSSGAPTFSQLQAQGQARPNPTPPAPAPVAPAAAAPSLLSQTASALGTTAPAIAPSAALSASLPSQVTSALAIPSPTPPITPANPIQIQPAGPTDTNGTNPAPPVTPSGPNIPPITPPITPANPPVIPPVTPPVGGTGGTSTAGTYTPNVAPTAISGPLTTAVTAALNQPNGVYSTDQMAQLKAASDAQIDQEFNAQQKQLDEEMAARGIGASSIASGYEGDLMGQQATAKSSAAASLLENEAQLAQQGQATALGAAGQLNTTEAQTGLGTAQLGLQGQLGLGSLALGTDQLGAQVNQNAASNQIATEGLNVTQGGLYNQVLAQLAQATGLPATDLTSIVSEILANNPNGTGAAATPPVNTTPPGTVGSIPGGGNAPGGSPINIPPITIPPINVPPAIPPVTPPASPSGTQISDPASPPPPSGLPPNTPIGTPEQQKASSSTGGFPVPFTTNAQGQVIPTVVPTNLSPSDPNNPNRDLYMAASGGGNPASYAMALNSGDPYAIQSTVQALVGDSNGNGPKSIFSSNTIGQYTAQWFASLTPQAQQALITGMQNSPVAQQYGPGAVNPIIQSLTAGNGTPQVGGTSVAAPVSAPSTANATPLPAAVAGALGIPAPAPVDHSSVPPGYHLLNGTLTYTGN